MVPLPLQDLPLLNSRYIKKGYQHLVPVPGQKDMLGKLAAVSSNFHAFASPQMQCFVLTKAAVVVKDKKCNNELQLHLKSKTIFSSYWR